MAYGKVKYGKMIENKISWKVLKIFIREGSNDDLWLTSSFSIQILNLLAEILYGKSSCFEENFGAQVRKYSYISEHKNILIKGLIYPLTFN